MANWFITDLCLENPVTKKPLSIDLIQFFMNKVLFAVLGTMVFATSCVQSLYPLAKEKNQVVFKNELLGKWKESDESEYFVDSSSNKTYRVTVVDHPKIDSREKKFSDTSHFLMTLVNVQGKYFLDCFPDTSHRAFYQLGEQTVNFLLPVHFILKVNVIARDSIEIASVSHDGLLKLINQKKFGISYHQIGSDQILLSQTPGKLQAKLTELDKFPSVYETSVLWRH